MPVQDCVRSTRVGRRALLVSDRSLVMYSFSAVMRGYDRRQVDELLARIEGTLGRAPAVSPSATVAEVRAARFDKRMRGYAPREVDQALRTAAAELEQQSP